jgi:glucose/arabinose dehydrogenase
VTIIIFLETGLLLLGGCQSRSKTQVVGVPTQTPSSNSNPIATLPIETLLPAITQTFTPSPSSIPANSPTSPPLPTPVSVIELEGATVAPGFSLTIFAEVYRPTALVFDASGHLYMTSVDSNIYRIEDTNLDGKADGVNVFSFGYFTPLGIAIHPETSEVFVSHQGQITAIQDTDGNGKSDTSRIVIKDLPFGRHQNDNLKFGPDGWLYMGVGSTCDACVEADARSATILRINPDTGQFEIYATGMRNPYDLAFHPLTGALFATDNGRDDLGLEIPKEELNHIVQGGNYGFPNCWDELQGTSCDGTIPAIAFFESHSSANGLVIYDGTQFPEAY